jgi:hypothetical protein
MQATEIQKRIEAYRKETFHTQSGSRLRTLEEALHFVNQRGFIFFWPIKGIEFPSLWTAVAGSREVANDHDDPGHVTWGWKDQMLDKKQWYYGRILRRKNTILSLEAMPYFYALTPNYGEYEIDYLNQYQQGLMTAESKAIYEALLFEGPLNTLALRQTSRMSSKSSTSRFQRALEQLQIEMKILPVGISKAGAWNYAFIYDIVPRHFTAIESEAQPISELEARAYILTQCLSSLGGETTLELKKLLRWKDKELNRTIDYMHGKNTFQIEEEILTGGRGLILKELR